MGWPPSINLGLYRKKPAKTGGEEKKKRRLGGFSTWKEAPVVWRVRQPFGKGKMRGSTSCLEGERTQKTRG